MSNQRTHTYLNQYECRCPTIFSQQQQNITTAKSEKQAQRMMILFSVICLTVLHCKLQHTLRYMEFFSCYLTGIQMSHTLECYSCSGGERCGILFSPNSTAVKIVKSTKTASLSSCSVRMIMPYIKLYHEYFIFTFFIQISVTPEGLTTRSLVPAHVCRSTSYQFCCNEDLCNTLASPPLPAFTSLKCDIGKCSMTNGICVYDDDYVTTLSSATDSCSVSKNVFFFLMQLIVPSLNC